MALTETAYKVSRRLLTPPRSTNIMQVARSLQPPVPQATAYKIVRWMKYHGAVSERENGYSVDLRRMLDLLAATRISTLLPNRVSKTHLDVEAFHKRLKEAQLDHIFAFATAANLTAYFEPLETIQVYVPTGASRKIADLAGKGDITVEVFEERLHTIPRRESSDGLPITELLRTAIDVRAHPRGGAYATILEDALSKGAGL